MQVTHAINTHTKQPTTFLKGGNKFQKLTDKLAAQNGCVFIDSVMFNLVTMLFSSPYTNFGLGYHRV